MNPGNILQVRQPRLVFQNLQIHSPSSNSDPGIKQPFFSLRMRGDMAQSKAGKIQFPSGLRLFRGAKRDARKCALTNYFTLKLFYHSRGNLNAHIE